MNHNCSEACAGCSPAPSQTTDQTTNSAAETVVALAGNPNTGKSTVFNALTGLRQHTGNWPGKTVVRAEGTFTHEKRRFRLVDLPGTYSLLSDSPDEEIARDFLLFGRPDVTVVMVDATALERNLNLVLQVLEITSTVVVCLNLMDEAARNGISIDDAALSLELGVPVVPAAARRGRGLDALAAVVADVAGGSLVPRPVRRRWDQPEIEDALGILVPQILKQYPNLPNARWVALRLLEGDQSVTTAFREGRLGRLPAVEQEAS